MQQTHLWPIRNWFGSVHTLTPVSLYIRGLSYFFNHQERIMKLIIKLLSSSLSLFLLLSLFISDGVYTVHSSRNLLLQTEKVQCPLDFQILNYTIITSQCKGPHYPSRQCCAAFKELACPYKNYLNDESTDCLTLMLSDINVYGGYCPVGLFGNTCLQGRQHIDCP